MLRAGLFLMALVFIVAGCHVAATPVEDSEQKAKTVAKESRINWQTSDSGVNLWRKGLLPQEYTKTAILLRSTEEWRLECEDADVTSWLDVFTLHHGWDEALRKWAKENHPFLP